ncbi:MAG TPA: hypothetical protein QGI07_01315 [Dehalococcoidia bacterium]|jgi:hypothetical protein|nr:hypothetical protein [Dehalococcoidia bacterium]MDP7213109.1 hypothetical protein [Dehalococcoidia bacterium]HJM52651.1 hypothetical protein [Dehalococcoidia bacterium]|tara:strand:+ start:354 stop:563 length:210 start_codon:yes stop_codon:yes gene_type:complete
MKEVRGLCNLDEIRAITLWQRALGSTRDDGSLEAVIAEAKKAVALLDETPRDREFISLIERAIQLTVGR